MLSGASGSLFGAAQAVADNRNVMSTTEKPHPIVSHLEIIEQRLGRIEKKLGIEDKPSPIISTRMIIMIITVVVFAALTFFGMNYMFDRMFSVLPI